MKTGEFITEINLCQTFCSCNSLRGLQDTKLLTKLFKTWPMAENCVWVTVCWQKQPTQSVTNPKLCGNHRGSFCLCEAVVYLRCRCKNTVCPLLQLRNTTGSSFKSQFPSALHQCSLAAAAGDDVTGSAALNLLILPPLRWSAADDTGGSRQRRWDNETLKGGHVSLKWWAHIPDGCHSQYCENTG